MKDQQTLTMKFMNILADRDTAIQERNLAFSEKKAAFAERDMAILQRDAAISERNNALMERDNALAAYEYHQKSTVNGSSASPTCPPECGIPRGMKHMHHPQHMHQSNHMAKAQHSSREMHINNRLSISPVPSESPRPRRGKRTKENKAISSNKKAASKPLSRKRGRRDNKNLNKQVTVAKTFEHCAGGEGSESVEEEEDEDGMKSEWRDDLGLNQVNFDGSSMPAPVCSCTGVLQQCYKWGKGGWQSACCTTTLSMYPLPVLANKRHSRLGGRKMSGSAFTKLLSRLASEGHDLLLPLDLKDHWSRHGTNRYITLK